MALMAHLHGVPVHQYIEWLDQVKNPRCHAIEKNGIPCESLLSIPRAKSPKEFLNSEHTFCYTHKEQFISEKDFRH